MLDLLPELLDTGCGMQNTHCTCVNDKPYTEPVSTLRVSMKRLLNHRQASSGYFYIRTCTMVLGLPSSDGLSYFYRQCHSHINIHQHRILPTTSHKD